MCGWHELAASHPRVIWTVWLIAATPLVACGGVGAFGDFHGWECSSAVHSGHALESPVRGVVSDYICLRFWPAFNLADVAIVAGGIGVIVTLTA